MFWCISLVVSVAKSGPFYMIRALWKEGLMHLRKVSAHVSLRRLTWAETFRYVRISCVSKDNSNAAWFSQSFDKMDFYGSIIINNSQTTYLDSSKLKLVADDNYQLHKNCIWSSPNRVENIVRKGKIARYEQFLLYPQCFQKTSLQTRKNKGFAGEGLMTSVSVIYYGDALSPLFLKNGSYRSIYPIPNDKVGYRSKLKAFADDKLNMHWMSKFTGA